MFDFSQWLDLPLIWSVLVAAAVFLYVWLDGFDLGVGILFPFAPTDQNRDTMMNSIVPFWDANETWLVLGGGGLLAAFPMAYAILFPAFYIPIIIMLLGLIMRGVAFEFRFRSEGSARYFWDASFHFGSLLAAFCQGMMLGAFVGGINVSGREYAGGPLDWISGFSVMTGMAVVCGYALLGSTWLVMKSTGSLQKWAREVASYVLVFVAIFMGLVSICMPYMHERVMHIWFSGEYFWFLLPLPTLTLIFFALLWKDLHGTKAEYRPFFLSMGIFLLGYLGIAVSLFPWMVPYAYTCWDVAGSGPGLSLLLVGVIPLLPLILGYTAYCYYIFRGKTSHEHHY